MGQAGSISGVEPAKSWLSGRMHSVGRVET